MTQTPPPVLIGAAAAYGLTLRRWRRVRRVWHLETNRGCFALKPAPPPAEADFLRRAEEHLAAQGFTRFPRLVRTAAGAPVCLLPSGERLVLRTWLPGSNPVLDLEHPRDLRRLAEAVAEMHLASLGFGGGICPDRDFPSWPTLLAARTADLDRFRSAAGRHGRFLRPYRAAIPAALEEAALARELLEASGYGEAAAEAREAGGLCHGDLAANNALVHGAHAYLLDLDRAERDIFAADLTRLIQRIAAAQDWDSRPGEALLEAYQCLRPLPVWEMRLVAAWLQDRKSVV